VETSGSSSASLQAAGGGDPARDEEARLSSPGAAAICKRRRPARGGTSIPSCAKSFGELIYAAVLNPAARPTRSRSRRGGSARGGGGACGHLPRGTNSGGHLSRFVVPGGGWYTALAGAQPVRYGTRTKLRCPAETDHSRVVDSVLPLQHQAVRLIRPQPADPEPRSSRGARWSRAAASTSPPRLLKILGSKGIQRVKWVYAR